MSSNKFLFGRHCYASIWGACSLLRPKTVEQQDMQSLLRIRKRLVEKPTANCNQLRSFLAEYGSLSPNPLSNCWRLTPLILENADNELSAVARSLIQRLYDFQLILDEQIEQVALDIQALAKAMPIYPLLLTLPGVGPVVSATILAYINDISDFKDRIPATQVKTTT